MWEDMPNLETEKTYQLLREYLVGKKIKYKDKEGRVLFICGASREIFLAVACGEEVIYVEIDEGTTQIDILEEDVKSDAKAQIDDEFHSKSNPE